MTTKVAQPSPSTGQSKATPRSGRPGRTMPIGASGDKRYRATATASTEPATTATSRPSNGVSTRWRPGLRRGRGRSGAPRPSAGAGGRGPGPAMRRAASAAMPPKTASAMDSGRMARSAADTSGWRPMNTPPRAWAAATWSISASTRGTSRLPWASWRFVVTLVTQHVEELAGQRSASTRCSRCRSPRASRRRRSTLSSTRPTTFMSILPVGLWR